MKNSKFILFGLFIFVSSAYADKEPCPNEVDREMKLVNMNGSFDHPGSCTSKDHETTLEGDKGYILTLGSKKRVPGTLLDPSVHYYPSTDDNKDGPTIKVTSNDLKGHWLSKIVKYDQACKAKSITFKTQGEVDLTVDKKTCDQAKQAQNTAKTVGIASADITRITIFNCERYRFYETTSANSSNSSSSDAETQKAQ